VAPAGRFVLSTDALVNDSGSPTRGRPWAQQTPVEYLPESTLVYLLGSRYCETDLLWSIAWPVREVGPTGWGRVQAICDFVHQHITFGYQHANAHATAWEASRGARRVPRLRPPGHRAVPLHEHPGALLHRLPGRLRHALQPWGTMDFAGWFEAYLGDRWYTFDARNNTPRIGRVLMARGRDACDVALSSTFGPNTLDDVHMHAPRVRLPAPCGRRLPVPARLCPARPAARRPWPAVRAMQPAAGPGPFVQ
jgi:transglutaminase-like putative cysteine protease